MTIILHLAQGLFALMAAGLFLGFIQSKHIGLFLATFVFGGGAYASFAMDAWWPLLAAFAGAWVLRLLGFDPNPQ
jgi:hypothetical protein